MTLCVLAIAIWNPFPSLPEKCPLVSAHWSAVLENDLETGSLWDILFSTGNKESISFLLFFKNLFAESLTCFVLTFFASSKKSVGKQYSTKPWGLRAAVTCSWPPRLWSKCTWQRLQSFAASRSGSPGQQYTGLAEAFLLNRFLAPLSHLIAALILNVSLISDSG